MEVTPGVGLPFVRLGDTLQSIESVAGPSRAHGAHGAVWATHSPPFGIFFGTDAGCELIEVYGSASDPDGATLDGVRLIGRPMGDVVRDLSRVGRCGRRTSLTVDYDDGLTLWSLGELSSGLAPRPDGRGAIVEGVAITRVSSRLSPPLAQAAS